MSEEKDIRFSELMRKGQQGDAVAYHQLLSELSILFKPYVVKRFRASDETDEVVQDILLAIHQSRQSYDPNKPFLPWAYTIARYRLIDHLRRWSRTRNREVGIEGVLDTMASEGLLPGDDEMDQQLEEALSNLPEQQRKMVTLLKIEGLSIKETSDKLGMSESAVKVSAHRGYQKLRKILGVNDSGNP